MAVGTGRGSGRGGMGPSRGRLEAQRGGRAGNVAGHRGAVDRALGPAVPCCVALAKRLSSLASVSLSRDGEGKVGLG